MVGRISTFGHSTAMLAAAMRTQAKLADQQSQTASGLKASTYGGLARESSALLRLSSQSSRLTADNTAAETAGQAVQAAYSAVGSIADLATTIKDQLASMISGSVLDADSAAQYASDWLNDLQTMLNSQQGGTYLFSGQATDTAPVDFAAAGYDGAVDGDTSYYQGSPAARALSASDGYSLTVSVQASDPAFAKLAHALALFAAQPDDTATITSAYDLVGEAVSGIATVQEGLSIRAASLDDLTERNTAKIDAITTLTTGLQGADLAQTAVLAKQYETQLEALYSTISTLASLSLTKYL